MSESVLKLDKHMTALECELWRKLRCHLTIEQKTTFTSDDFRLMGLDRFLQGDTVHSVGLWFWKLKQNGLSEDTGQRVPSLLPKNHGREIKLFRVVEAKP